MAVHFSILLLLSGVTGICSITTVRKVSVKTGKSISIPCLYSSENTDKVKYLCEGYSWHSCTFVAQTNQPQNSDKFSITDDKTQRIFTVTISKLDKSNNNFWCVSGVQGSYIREYFYLSVTKGESSLYTEEQNYVGYIGENITIKCFSKVTGVKKWCRLGGPCVTDSIRDGAIHGTTVTINTSVPGGFNVTMSKLRSESEGWYYCEAGDFQMPVYIRVQNRPVVTTITDGKSETTTGTSGKQEKGSTFDLKILLIPLGLLILIVTMTISIWLILQRRRGKAEASATTEDEVTYSSVVHVKPQSAQRGDERELDSMYSSVKPKKKRAASAADDVTYSTLTGNYNI
ncbi:uncharacterized protein LOC114477014 isoform X2 [Gouania willdenowi]|uniref:uncharacterized protein LOC114477014 isoform X2 n=1 Tax=Gouania willdenowi TaxID=441366 RepID=UPI001054F547|nr:uncharacterized protein LOC114477014 isoform X2 [Gouania willdenowi]